MAVKRIVANAATENTKKRQHFTPSFSDSVSRWVLAGYKPILPMDLLSPQFSIATDGGSGTPVPDLSIKVDNFYEVFR